jgi:hypothetical protein
MRRLPVDRALLRFVVDIHVLHGQFEPLPLSREGHIAALRDARPSESAA